MNSQQTISGTKALERMRNLRKVSGATFMMIHIACNLKTGQCGELRKVERCRLRAGLVSDAMTVDPDHYLPYEDIDLEQPKMCFKKLARFVAFPPNYELLKVDWFHE
jgi:hypothetical protein